MSHDSASVFRIDRLAVPAAAMGPLLAQVERNQARLRAQPGCRQAHALVRPADAEGFNLMTVVEWADARAMTAAKAVMDALHAAEGFDPGTFRQGLGVRTESAVYGPAVVSAP